MNKQAIKTELLIDGKKVLIGHDFLESIVRHIPDIKENREIFDALVFSNNPEILEYLTQIDGLSKKSIHILLNDDDQNVIAGVLTNADLAKHIKHKSLMKIIKSDNTKLLMWISASIESYVKCDLPKIIKILANHKSAAVRYQLVKWRASDIVSTKILKKLSKDSDADVAKAAESALNKR